ncbi:MAG: Gfo/Idh/MocA family oxidoreductase [Minicystis sp.]
MGSARSAAERLRVGIVGYGAVGRRRRAVIEHHPDLVLIALCDPAGAPSADGLRCHARVDDLLAEDLDALFVCVPPVFAAEATITALTRGLSVFCEKPPCCSLQEMLAVRAAEAARPDLRLMYGFNHRLHGSVRRAREIVASGELGRVVNLRGVYGRSFVADPPDAWRAQRAMAGGGILLDQGIHLLDLARLFAGDFVDVHAFVGSSAHGLDLEDNAYALLRTADGVVAMLHSSATEWRHRFRLEITLSEGTLELRGILSSTGAYAPEELLVRRRGAPGRFTEETSAWTEDTSWAEEIDAFARSLRSGAPVDHGASRDALAVMDLIDRIHRAA